MMALKPPNPKYIPMPYEQMQYPRQRIQIDVKYVPSVCLVGEAQGRKFYQYTAIDGGMLKPFMNTTLIPLLCSWSIS